MWQGASLGGMRSKLAAYSTLLFRLLLHGHRRRLELQVLFPKAFARERPAHVGRMAHLRAVDHDLRVRMLVKRGIDRRRWADRVDKTDAVQRLALELAGEIHGVEILARGFDLVQQFGR